MKGDFTRDTFDPARQYSRVLMQQGRVSLDADFNEQSAILLHFLRTLARDLIGPFAGVGDAFALSTLEQGGRAVPFDFQIAPGHYYVDGILCENAEQRNFTRQPSYPLGNANPLRRPEGPTAGFYLAYLDVSEIFVSAISDPLIREGALGGPDTAGRAQMIWQVKTWPVEEATFADVTAENIAGSEPWQALLETWQPVRRGLLQAQAFRRSEDPTDPCILSPGSRYRGPENQLYRVEIHTGGPTEAATFKWSRDNGSVTIPIVRLQGSEAVVEYTGRDARLGLQPGDWVEIGSNAQAYSDGIPDLVEIATVDVAARRVGLRLRAGQALPVFEANSEQRPYFRRWDYRLRGGASPDGAIPLEEGRWLDLEDGVRIRFSPRGGEGAPGAKAVYRTGDYWLIPARTDTGDVLWPGDPANPEPRPPHGVEHHYAPLARIALDDNGEITGIVDYRRRLREA